MTRTFIVEAFRAGTWVTVARFAVYADAGAYVREHRGRGEGLRTRQQVDW